MSHSLLLNSASFGFTIQVGYLVLYKISMVWVNLSPKFEEECCYM